MNNRFTALLMAGLLGVLFLLSACGKENTAAATLLEFKLTNQTGQTEREEVIHCSEAMDALTLDAQIKLESGSVTITISPESGGEPVWNKTYTQGGDDTITLADVKADSQYSITVTANETKSTQVRITSDVKLVKDPPVPEKPAKEPKTK